MLGWKSSLALICMSAITSEVASLFLYLLTVCIFFSYEGPPHVLCLSCRYWGSILLYKSSFTYSIYFLTIGHKSWQNLLMTRSWSSRKENILDIVIFWKQEKNKTQVQQFAWFFRNRKTYFRGCLGNPRWCSGKESACNAETRERQVWSLGQENPLK